MQLSFTLLHMQRDGKCRLQVLALRIDQWGPIALSSTGKRTGRELHLIVRFRITQTYTSLPRSLREWF